MPNTSIFEDTQSIEDMEKTLLDEDNASDNVADDVEDNVEDNKNTEEDDLKIKVQDNNLRALEASLKEANDKIARFEAVLARLQAPKEEKEAEVEPEIDPEKDPVGFISAEMARLRKDIAELKGHADQQKTTTDQNTVVAELMSHAQRSFAETAKKIPDFNKAIEHLNTVRMQELRDMGYDDTEANNIIARDVIGIAYQCKNRGISVGEVCLKLAKQRGYKSEGVDELAQKRSEQERRAKSLSAGNTKAQLSGQVSIEDVLNADDENFDKFWLKFSKG